MAKTLNEAFNLYGEYIDTRNANGEYIESGILDNIFLIDAINREIITPENEDLFGVYNDMDVERKYFQCPRYVGDNIDLSKSIIFINYISVGGNTGQYRCDDVNISGDNITFSWLLSRNLFDKNKDGFVWFAMMAKKADGLGNLKTVFNTKKTKGIVSQGIQADEEITEQYADIILQLLSQMDTVTDLIKPGVIEGYIKKHLQDEGALEEVYAKGNNKDDLDLEILIGGNTVNIGKIEGDYYILPDGGIPKSDLSSDVQSALLKAENAYNKPVTGIPSSDLSEDVRLSLQKANTAVQTIPQFPTSLKNPNAITFTGAVSATYDGSIPITVNIPTGGGGGSKNDNVIYISTSNDSTGTTDTNSIKLALSELYANGGGVLELGVGIFYINEVIELPENCYIKGTTTGVANSPSNVSTNKGTVLRAMDNYNIDVIHLFNNNSGIVDCMIIGSGGNYMNHSQLNAYATTPTTYGGCGIVYGHLDKRDDIKCYVQNVEIQRCTKAGLLISPNTWVSNFINIFIRRCACGLMLSHLSSDCTFIGINIDNCTDCLVGVGSGNHRLIGIKLFDAGKLNGNSTADGQSYGMFLNGCTNFMCNSIESQESLGQNFHFEYCKSCNFIGIIGDRGAHNYTEFPWLENVYNYYLSHCLFNVFVCTGYKMKKGLYIDSSSKNNKVVGAFTYLDSSLNMFEADIDDNGVNNKFL